MCELSGAFLVGCPLCPLVISINQFTGETNRLLASGACYLSHGNKSYCLHRHLAVRQTIVAIFHHQISFQFACSKQTEPKTSSAFATRVIEFSRALSSVCPMSELGAWPGPIAQLQLAGGLCVAAHSPPDCHKSARAFYNPAREQQAALVDASEVTANKTGRQKSLAWGRTSREERRGEEITGSLLAKRQIHLPPVRLAPFGVSPEWRRRPPRAGEMANSCAHKTTKSLCARIFLAAAILAVFKIIQHASSICARAHLLFMLLLSSLNWR